VLHPFQDTAAAPHVTGGTQANFYRMFAWLSESKLGIEGGHAKYFAGCHAGEILNLIYHPRCNIPVKLLYILKDWNEKTPIMFRILNQNVFDIIVHRRPQTQLFYK
jgi:hypothetical protein